MLPHRHPLCTHGEGSSVCSRWMPENDKPIAEFDAEHSSPAVQSAPRQMQSPFSLPLSPKLLRSPTFHGETAGQSVFLERKCMHESMLLHVFKWDKSYFASLLKYAQCCWYEFWINANVSIWVLLQLMNTDVFIFLYFFVLGLLMKMLENSGFEKQLVTNSLSAFSLSLAVLSTQWKTCIHYLSLAPKNNSCMLV